MSDRSIHDTGGWGRTGPVGRWTAALALLAAPARAQQAQAPSTGGSPFLDWALLAGGLALIWLLFYKGLYPILLRHYRPDDCKFFFWSLTLLYALGWAHLSLYVLFEIGFYLLWARWVAIFLAALWLIWFVIAMLVRRRA